MRPVAKVDLPLPDGPTTRTLLPKGGSHTIVSSSRLPSAM
jgi:hypothetical protein